MENNNNPDLAQVSSSKTFAIGGPKLTEGSFFVAWLVFFLSTSIGTPVAGAVVGAIIGAMLGLVGADAKVIMVVCGVIGFIVGGVMSYLLFRLIVKKMIIDKLLSIQ